VTLSAPSEEIRIMTERFREAMRKLPPYSNADDPTADRLGSYPEAGELRSPQDAIDRDAGGPTPPQPAGLDSQVIMTGGSGRPIGGPASTDPPGQAPGMPPADAPARDDEPSPDAERGPRDQGSFVDGLDR
jgi:hypothetical protein